MKIGYGYRRNAADLTALGAEKVFIDVDRRRSQRDLMLSEGRCREDDEILVLYLRDLGGSPKADIVWREKVEALGATVTERRPVKKPGPGRTGRPKKVNWTEEQTLGAKSRWLGPGTEAVRLERVEDFIGYKVGKGLLSGRFGVPSNPK